MSSRLPPTLASRAARRGFAHTALLLATLLAAAATNIGLAAESDAGPLLAGVTVDSAGQPLSGVQIVVTAAGAAEGQVLRSLRSDERGRFVVAGLQPGAYRIVAIKGGYSVLVGRVDTLLRDFLEVVLQPSGPPGPPGSKPDGSGWALRLPSRDVLEDREATAATSDQRPVDDGSARLRPPVLVEVQSAALSDAGAEESGVSLALSGGAPIEGYGRFEGSFRHRDVGRAGSLRDASDTLVARWTPSDGLSSGIPAIELSGLSQSRQGRLAASPADRAGFERFGLGFVAHWGRTRDDRRTEANLDARFLSGTIDGGAAPAASPADDFYARRISLDLDHQRAWGGSHVLQASLGLRHADGGRTVDPWRRRAVVPALFAADGPAALDSTRGGLAQLTLADRFRPASRVQLQSGWRFKQLSDDPAGTRAGTSLGAAVDLSPWVTARLEGGLLVAEAEAPQRSWAVELEARGAGWAFSLRRGDESGFSPLVGDGTRELRPAHLVTDDGGRIRSLGTRLAVSPGGSWPTVALQAQRLEMSGPLAASWAGDLPLAPLIDQGRGVSDEVELIVDNTGSGTWVSIGWSEVRERGASTVLLDGADGWRRKQVRLRQRLGPAQQGGWNWHLLVSVEAGEVLGSRPQGLRTPRLALLDQRRLSGGVALAF